METRQTKRTRWETFHEWSAPLYSSDNGGACPECGSTIKGFKSDDSERVGWGATVFQSFCYGCHASGSVRVEWFDGLAKTIAAAERGERWA